MKKDKKELLKYIFGWVIVLTFFGTLILLFIYPIPPGNKDVVLLGAGTLFTAFITVVNYEYGSSSGSQRKTEIMNNQSNNTI